MSSATPRRFPGDCRRFLAELVDHLAPGSGEGHAAECPRCAQRLRAARTQAALFAAVPPVEVAPLANHSVDDLYEALMRQGEARMGHVLRNALTPVVAPADVAWKEVEASPLHIDTSRAPGWMWSRIRTTLPSHRRAHSGFSVVRTAAAAALVICAILLFHKSSSPTTIGGTTDLQPAVWMEAKGPIDPTFTMNGFMTLGK